ncbi:MAG: biotin--[acetyl-CoA-carboxylase] ligase [Nitriliruptorales bacterium]|nr:biotin--[acetyl-CoA-carboxylase] ligase [Nitriliruptorales bacterium]
MPTSEQRLVALVQGPSRWHSIEHVPTTSSTNDLARELTEAGTGPGLVVLAETQTEGRGRAGRAWLDQPGGDLLVSVTTGIPSGEETLVPLAAGLAIADAVRRHGLHVSLKWPNDVLAGGRKLAGVLVERLEDALVIGIGVDIDWRDVDRSGELTAWTSMAEETGADVDRWDVLTDLLRSLDTWLRDLDQGDAERLLAQYQLDCSTIGQQVVVTTPAGDVVEGRAIGLDATGALGVDTADGPIAVIAGDVTVR